MKPLRAACLVMRHASFLFVPFLEGEPGWVRGGGRGEDLGGGSFEGFRGWGPGG